MTADENNIDWKPSSGPTGPVPMPGGKKSGPYGLQFDRTAIPGVRQVVVVGSGKGGVGKSTVSVNLAVGLAQRGLRVGLLDADIYGPSAPMMLGLSGDLQVTVGNRIVPKVGAAGVKTVSFGFLTDAQTPVIWRGPMLSKALRQLCYDVEWGELDFLVIDLPPGTGDVQLTLVEKLPIHQAIIVTTPQDVALLDAQKAVSMFRKLEVPIRGFVENMAHFRCGKCGHSEAIFGAGGVDALAARSGAPVLARIPLESLVRAGGDSGQPVVLREDSPVAGAFKMLASFVAND